MDETRQSGRGCGPAGWHRAASLGVAVSLLALMGCRTGPSYEERTAAWRQQLAVLVEFNKGYLERLRAYKADVEEFERGLRLVEAHPAFPAVREGVRVTAAMIAVEKPEQPEQFVRELLEVMDLDQLRVFMAWTELSLRAEALEGRRQELMRDREAVSAEVERLRQELVEEERAARAAAVDAAWALALGQAFGQALGGAFGGAWRAPAAPPLNCTTQYIGSMAYTHCY